MRRRTLTIRWQILLALLVPGVCFGADPFRLESYTPSWLNAWGETRLRFETLDGQFRANGEGGDQLLLARTLLHVEANADPLTFGLELQDSRTYMGDSGTPLSNSIANPLDILQLYVRVDDVFGVLGEDARGAVVVGRQTVSIGSKRQIERVDFANVIKSYTGIHYTSTRLRGDELHLVYVVPTARFPNDRDALDDNKLAADKEQWGRRIWGVHYRRADLLSGIWDDLWGEVFLYGLSEYDTDKFATPNRSHIAPGFRLYRKPELGRWDIDLEGALRRGERRASSAEDDRVELDVQASMLFVALGYTFDLPWRPRVALEYYYASGDDDPNDLDFQQHERLFGSRRTDLNNTSIHGPLTPANLKAPGLRIEVKPNARWDARFYYHAAYLESPTDTWVIAKRQDSTGAAGDFIGHVLDARARYWLIPDSVRLEFGASALLGGKFVRDAPDAPQNDDTMFGYLQASVTF